MFVECVFPYYLFKMIKFGKTKLIVGHIVVLLIIHISYKNHVKLLILYIPKNRHQACCREHRKREIWFKVLKYF